MIAMILSAAAARPAFTCEVVRVHDGDGPLWCRSGEKVRVAGIQAPDFANTEPCRRPAARRVDYPAMKPGMKKPISSQARSRSTSRRKGLISISL